MYYLLAFHHRQVTRESLGCTPKTHIPLQFWSLERWLASERELETKWIKSFSLIGDQCAWWTLHMKHNTHNVGSFGEAILAGWKASIWKRFLKEEQKHRKAQKSTESAKGRPAYESLADVKSIKTKLCSLGICTKEFTQKFEIQDDFGEFMIVKAVLGSELNFWSLKDWCQSIRKVEALTLTQKSSLYIWNSL